MLSNSLTVGFEQSTLGTGDAWLDLYPDAAIRRLPVTE
jgi:hypothetical protein